jgi:hypothetical protein
VDTASLDFLLTFNKSNVNVSSTGAINVFWYADAYVNDTGGNPIESANVTSTTTSGTLSNWSLTNSTGYTSRLTLREYMQNATSSYFDTNYTINASKTGYNANWTAVNLTNNAIDGNLGKVVLTLWTDITAPNIEFISPTPPNNNVTTNNFVYVNVSVSDASNISTFIDWNQSLRAWWRFNNESGENSSFFRDWSSWGNNGTCNLGSGYCPTYNLSGKLGKALDFDGSNDYIDLGNPTSFPNGTSARTMCAWATTNSVSDSYRMIVSYGFVGPGNAMFIGMKNNTLIGGGMWYWDRAGEWNITVIANDTSGLVSTPNNKVFNLSESTCFVLSPSQLTWPAHTPGSTNTTSDNDPTLLNNTCNDMIELNNVQVKALDLYGTNPSYSIGSGNFSSSIQTSGLECAGSELSNNTFINITNAILSAGNNSLNFGNETSGQEELYYCLKQTPTGIIAQTYSTDLLGSWVVRIVASMALVIPLRRRKKKSGEDKLLAILKLSISELKERYGLSTEEVIRLAEEKSDEKTIPLSLFKEDLGALEVLVKYMKENMNLSYREISKLLNRNERTIWTTYQNSNKKLKEKIEVKPSKMSVPISIFANRKLSILESLVSYLKQNNLQYHEISRLINRDQRNIWTINSRAKKKNKTSNQENKPENK